MGAQHTKFAPQNGGIDATVLMQYFTQVGRTNSLKPGSVLIVQGQPSESVYLLVEGTTVLKKYSANGEAKEIGSRGAGQLLGELSFLLGTIPAVSVEVAGDTPLKFIEAKQSRLLELLHQDPEVAGNVFRLLGVVIGDRIVNTSASMKSSLIQSSQSGQTTQKSAGALDAPPEKVAQKFGIPENSPFVMNCDCTLSIEENSVSKGHDHAATIYLFQSHICIEVTAFGFTNLRAIPLRDVLGLLRKKKSKVVEVQCKSFSLSVTLPDNIYEQFISECEQARMDSMDLATFAVEKQARKGSLIPENFMTPKGGAKGGLVVDTEIMELMRDNAQSRSTKASAHLSLDGEEWKLLLQGADQLKYRREEVVIREGDSSRALYQIVKGSLRVELKVKGRPQAVVVARRQAGEVFGERTLLLGGTAAASIVIDSDTAVLIRLREDYLNKLFKSRPELPGKFFCFLATDLAKRLQRLTEEYDTGELVLPKGTKAPSDIATMVGQPAYLAIMQKYVAKRPDAAVLGPQLEFIAEHRLFYQEADPKQLYAYGQQIFYKYMHSGSASTLTCISEKMRQQLQTEVKNTKLPPAKYRNIFAVAHAACVKSIEVNCLSSFLQSPQYNYVLALKLKESHVPTMEQFMALRVLGEGGFGQVLEVVKRDCGKHYAMKVMKKHELIAAFRSEHWKETVLLERRLQSNLHHPLLVNLAYSFQNVHFLVLVMDACPGGDLSVFALSSERLTPPQVRFVGLETTAVLSFLHDQFVLYRDLKPENLLLDAEGHVRLIDFGLALAGNGAMPTSMEHCGTPCYMAPEVKSAARKKQLYSGPADWYTLGVLMYELTEQNLPFGDDPRFANARNEYRKPQMLGERGQYDDLLHDMVLRLLEWKPEKRLGFNGSGEIKKHKYWNDPEWQLVDARKLPSPLKNYVQQRSGPRAEKLRKQQRAAVETAVNMAKADVAGAKGVKGSSGNSSEVAGWDFVSSHAINQEYVESQVAAVSMV
ncbi:hypothetical protein AB1Y20_023528 [Prymnesium parvum]|uniref:cGMP-dependent protein kinase n=1 Tax=Prymnesium parvum TaxID=97485 RepID=A0AB34JF10_PRYPA